MIYVDMKCFQMKKDIDIRLDEHMNVEQLLSEVSKTFSLENDNAQIVSVRRKKILDKSKSLLSQGIPSGDTLILIHNKG